MASGFFALFDDISALMDDVVVMSKISTKKTAGILGDDLAVNAEKASGFVSSRELPVLWAISKGSLVNKIIILPIAFLLSYFFPPAITGMLLLGGVYLAFEGAEKIYEFFVPHHSHPDIPGIETDFSEKEILDLEKKKIKSAILTDFILSVEIVIIALGTVMDKTLTIQIIVVSIVAIIATVGVYGLVALIVRMDDFGLRLIKTSEGKKNALYHIGNALVRALPKIVKGISIIGTLALLLVSGGIFIHNIDQLHHVLESLPGILREFLIGLAVGLVALLIFKGIKKVISFFK
ncbi:DUF808 domain-containing protein [Galbibacter sp. EGI 63066]|uniref:DUF808 domain-containing protein n=1 Tax=Galbibacter sp. EGI 63066 TaxID=2993559 RepID=UPI002248A88E|nr:DUF808 domain-containing protein [Galbibacter sp. EGI 63066]MCX2681517.1 DUF808 domain-containing protein [Galbibacter sp. EGI 63066]